MLTNGRTGSMPAIAEWIEGLLKMDRTETRRYPGATDAEREAAFAADRQLAETMGWYPSDQFLEKQPWGPPVLAVLYRYRPPEGTAAPAGVAAPILLDQAPSPTMKGLQVPPTAPAGRSALSWVALVLLAAGMLVVVMGLLQRQGLDEAGPGYARAREIGYLGFSVFIAGLGVVAWTRKGLSRNARVACVLIAALFVLGQVGAVASPSLAPGTIAQRFEITSHQNGQTVATATVTVRGTAPAGAEVVHDISGAPDDRVTADAAGNWALDVILLPGGNAFTFRVGDDKSTAVVLALNYGTVADAVTPAPAASSDALETQAALPVQLSFGNEGNNTEPWASRPFDLPTGTYEAKWSVKTSSDCGATINMYRDPDDGFAREIASVSVGSSTGGVADLGDVPAGRYILWSYVGCPWTVALEQAAGSFASGADLRAQWLAWDNALGDATSGLLSQWTDGLPAAGMSITAATDTAVTWIDGKTASIRPEQQVAVQQWRDAAVRIGALGDTMRTATSIDELQAAMSSVETIRALRSDVADAFVAIR